MTGVGKFIVAVFVSFFLMIGALGSSHPVLLICLAFIVWILFVLSVSGSSKKYRAK